MCRCGATMSRLVAVRGMIRYEGSPHHGLARSPSASNGESLFMDSAAVLTSAIVASDSARGSDVHGIGSVEPEPRAISMRAIAVDVGLRYLKESIAMGPLYRGFGSAAGSDSSASTTSTSVAPLTAGAPRARWKNFSFRDTQPVTRPAALAPAMSHACAATRA